MPRRPRRALPIVALLSSLLVLAVNELCIRNAGAQVRMPFFVRPGTSVPTGPNERAKVEAEQAYQRGDYARTVELTDGVLRLEARDYVALYLRASARVELGRLQRDSRVLRDGIADAREAIRLTDSNNVNCYLPYLYGMVSLAAIEKHRPHAEVAVQVADQLVGSSRLQNDERANVLYQRAGASMFLQNHAAAIKDYEDAIARQPSHLGAYVALSDAYAASGNVEKAAATFDRSVSTFPNNPLVFNNRGMFFQARGQSDKAIADFSRAIELDANYFIAYLNRGFTLMETGKLSEAEADFTISLRINPRQPTAHSLRGTARLAQRQLAPAIEDYREVVRQDERNPVAHADLGFAQFFSQDYSGALASFDQAVKLDANMRYVDPWRYWARVCSGHATEAGAAFQSVLQKPEKQRDWTDFLLLFLMEKVDEAALTKAISSQDAPLKSAQTCEAQFFIGQLREHNGQTDQATAHYRQALEGDVKHLSAYRGAQLALQRLSRQPVQKR